MEVLIKTKKTKWLMLHCLHTSSSFSFTLSFFSLLSRTLPGNPSQTSFILFKHHDICAGLITNSQTEKIDNNNNFIYWPSYTVVRWVKVEYIIHNNIQTHNSFCLILCNYSNIIHSSVYIQFAETRNEMFVCITFMYVHEVKKKK